MKLRAYLVDDEAPALRRLTRLLEGRVDIAGASTDPEEALAALDASPVDVAFLDIQMPGMTGLELARRLRAPPRIVFCTAYDRHALAAFEINAVDYLLKPVRPADLERALARVTPRPATDELRALVTRLEDAARRIPSRLGDRITLLELSRISHFRAEDRLTLAITDAGEHVVDETITELEARLGAGFVRIHRAALVNVAFIEEIHASLAGTRVRLRDRPRSELPVARDRVKALKARLGVT